MSKKHLILIALVTIFLLLPGKSKAEAPIVVIPPRDMSVRGIIEYRAKEYGVSLPLMHKIIKCESSYNPQAKNITKREQSYGLVQINRLAHPSISIEQATDPDFAAEFLAKNLAKGNGKIWSCYK